MIKIYFIKGKQTMCENLSKRDARKFLKNFKGEKKPFSSDAEEFNFTMKCKFPKGYRLDVFEYNDKKGDALQRAFDLMDGDLNG